VTSDRCYDFLNISAKKLAFLTQNKAKLCTNVIITLVFEKNANIFAEIVKNCDHNIDPRESEFSTPFGKFMKVA
jgi:hypothetical protein